MNLKNQRKSRHLLKKIYFKHSNKTSKQNYLNLSYKIYRPLLDFSRLDFLKFCEFWKLPVYPDWTNFNVTLQRNRLRLELLPYLKLFFNKNLFNKIKPIQNLLNLENQYFQLLIQKISFIFLKTNIFVFDENNLFQFIRLKIKMNYFLNKSRHFKTCKQNTLLKLNYKTNKIIVFFQSSIFQKQDIEKIVKLTVFLDKKPNIRSNPILYNININLFKMFSKKPLNTIAKKSKFILAEIQLNNAWKYSKICRIQNSIKKKFFPLKTQVPMIFEIPIFFSKRLSQSYINAYFSVKFELKNDLFYSINISWNRLNLNSLNQSNIKYNFLFLPKILQYRILYNFYYSFRKKISFNEINHIFEKLNIKKK